MGSSNIRDILTSFSPGLDFFAISTGDGRIKIWDTIKGQVQTEFANILSTEETDFFAKPTGGHLSVDYTCMKWLSLDKKKKRKLRSSLLILGTGGGDVLALDVSAGVLKWRISDCHPGGVSAVSFPTNGLCIYTGGADGMVCQLDSMTGNLLAKFKASTKAISSMTVSPDGKNLATAAAQLKVFSCSDHKKLQKFSGHPGPVRCMIFSEDGKYLLSSAVGERYVAVWKVDGSKKKAACCVLSMDHPAIFIDSRSVDNEDVNDTGLSVLAISEVGVCYFWSVKNITELHNSKSTKVALSVEDSLAKNQNSAMPTIFAAKLQGIAKPVSGHVFLAHGLLIKPTFEKILLQPGIDVKLTSSLDGILLPINQSSKSKKESDKQNQVTALDRTNAEGALLPVPRLVHIDDARSKAMPASNEDVQAEEVTICMEDRLRAQGILRNDGDFTSDVALYSGLLKDINLKAHVPPKKMRRTVLSMNLSDAYSLLKVLLAMWQSRSSPAEYILQWICCLLVNFSDSIRSQEQATQLINSLYKLTKSRGENIHSLLQLSGRLQLITAQIDKAANRTQILENNYQVNESEEEKDDDEEEEEEEEEEFLYGEEDEEESPSSSEEDN